MKNHDVDMVRPSLPEDTEGIRRVSESGNAKLRETYRPNRKALENRRRFSSQLNRLIALVEGEIAGTTQFYREYSESDKHRQLSEVDFQMKIT